ncbi:MAG: MFS transporter [Natrialbaceae archaeon]|nr:MFS transporter [Natrialbaceae archaeon]
MGEAPENGALRQLFSFEPDVLVLSGAMFAFSLGFQMTSRFLPEYLTVLGASAVVVGLYGTLGNLIAAVFPYYGGVISDRIGSRYALTLFGVLSTIGFGVWLVAAFIPVIDLGPVSLEPWIWIFVGLILAQAWKSFGLGATFAVVRQSVRPDRLARGFASTETVRRTAFLIGPLVVTVLVADALMPGFLWVLGLAIGFGVLATVVQHVLYDASADTIGTEFQGLEQIRHDIEALPTTLRPLLIADTIVRFANGMVYIFFILVVTDLLEVGLTVPVPGLEPIDLSPTALFGVLLSLEMLVALISMGPTARAAERVGLKPVVGLGFLVYAIFPVLFILAPPNAAVLLALFAFSGLRFAGLPGHKALIVGPADRDTGGRVTGTYYLIRNAVVIPSAALGGLLWAYVSPEVAFSIASILGVIGVLYFARYGQEFDAYSSAPN